MTRSRKPEHPDERQLLAHAESALAPENAAAIDRHLASCARCRENHRGLLAGTRAARDLAEERMPAEVAQRIRREVLSRPVEASSETAAGRGRRGFTSLSGWLPAASGRRVAVAASLAVLLAGGGWLLARRGPDVVLERAAGAPLAFEEAARRAHAGLAQGLAGGGAELELASSSPAAVRRWVEEETGLRLALADHPPVGAGGGSAEGGFVLRGARRIDAGGVPAVAVAYRVDGRPVTLLAARQDDVPDAPRWSLLGKRVRWTAASSPGEGHEAKLLTWTNSGSAYTLVSELPGLGQRACLLCHAENDRRRRLIEGLEEA